MSLLCQVCGAANPDETEHCRRCHQKLLVVSGVEAAEEELYEESREESFSFDEHLLERISVLEEAVKRTTETVRQLLGALRKQERTLLINHAGILTARELLEGKGLVEPEEWGKLWGSKMDYQLLALEKRERFLTGKERIVALYAGGQRRQFLDLLEDAEYALYGFDVAAAVSSLEKAFELDRANYELAVYLGEFYFNEGDRDRALAFFGHVLAAAPDHYEGLVYSGVICNERGEAERAELLLKRAVARYPGSFLPAFSLGASYAARGQLAPAVQLLEEAVASDPVPHALYLLGRSYHEMGRAKEAIRTLREAVRRDPAFEEAHYQLGLVYLDRRWHKKALDCFRSAQLLNPRRMRYQDLVRYLSGQASTPLPPVEGDVARFLEEAEAHVARQQHRQAAASLEKALEKAPEHPTLLITYATVCLALDRAAEIEAVAQKVLAGNPDEMLRATAYATWIAALRSQGQLREGNRLGRQLLEEGRGAFARTIAYYEMAYNLAEMEEDLDQALEYAKSSLELAPEELQAFPMAALGWVHYKRKELDLAVQYLARASELGAPSTTLSQLGMALLASGEDEEARTVLSRARGAADRGQLLAERMIDVMKDSGRLLEQVRRRQNK